MSTLPLKTGKQNTVLRKTSTKVMQATKEIKNLIKKMLSTVQKENGVGLAAPQVGYNERIIVAKIKNRFIPMINPEIKNFSLEKNLDEEGCLSVPGEWGKVWRYNEILLEYQDEKMKSQTLRLHDFEARIIQHEIDHLDGILFTDKIETFSSQKSTFSPLA